MSDQRYLHVVIQLAILTLASFVQYCHQQQCPAWQCNCFNTSRELLIICRDKQLTVIPTFTDTGVTYDEINFGSTYQTGCWQLYCIGKNTIYAVPANAFANLRVKKIILTQNIIGTYDFNAFSGLEGVISGTFQ